MGISSFSVQKLWFGDLDRLSTGSSEPDKDRENDCAIKIDFFHCSLAPKEQMEPLLSSIADRQRWARPQYFY